MNSIKKTIDWLDLNREYAYSLIRIFLGIALFIRGIIMISNPSAITNLIGGRDLYFWYSLIMVAHLFGGLFLTIGLQTRLAALIQLPILIGAVFFLHIGQGLIENGQSLELSVLVLFLLVVYLLFGAGSFALDNRLGTKDKL